MAYVGTPIDTTNQFQSLVGKRFSGDASTTAFTLDVAPSSTLDIEVFVENVRQDPNSAYSLSGTTLTFAAAPPSGTNNIYVVHQAKAVGTISPAAGTVNADSFDNTVISGHTALAETPADTDEFLISDGGTIKRIDFSHIKGQGKIAQVVNTTKTDTFSTTSGSYTDVTGLSAAITPTASSHKILIHATIWSGGQDDAYPFFRLLRGSTEIGSGTGNSGSNNVNAFAGGFFTAIASMQYRQHCLNRHFLDSPSSVSEVTYKIQGKNAYTAGSAGIVYVNRAHNDGDNLFAGCCQSELVLMEIVA